VDGIEWHIITGSKGGAGKSLLTMLLLIYLLKEKGQQGSTLLVDLNSMNPDSSTLLCPRLGSVNIKKPCTIRLQTEIRIPPGTDRLVTLDASSILDGKPYDFIVSRTLNPFGSFNNQLFGDLLSTIKGNANEIAEAHQIVDDTGRLLPLKHVIIDTNYHFCNLFSQEKADYARYINGGDLAGENINIWFMWVYRQLLRFVHDRDESHIIRNTAQAIENNLNSYRQGDENRTTPFLHVFNPAGLISSNPNKQNKYRKIWEKVIFGQNPLKDFPIEEFIELEKCNTMDDVYFINWIKKLTEGRKAEAKRLNDDPYFLLIDIVINAIRFLNGMDDQEPIPMLLRPKNVIPLSVYHFALQEFTDKISDDPLSQLAQMEICKNFLDVLKKSFAAN